MARRYSLKVVMKVRILPPDPTKVTVEFASYEKV